MSANPIREQLQEQADRQADRLAQERAGATAHPVGTQSPGYVHYGDLAYVPGELLPAEVAAALLAQRPEPDERGVYQLKRPSPPVGRRKRPKETT